MAYEPRCEKTGLRGFRLGLTQTRLYDHTRWLEAEYFVFRKKSQCPIYVAKTKALISFAVTAKLICIFVLAYAKNLFLTMGLIIMSCYQFLESFSEIYVMSKKLQFCSFPGIIHNSGKTFAVSQASFIF